MDWKTVAPLVLTSTVLSGVFTVIGNHMSAVWREGKTLKTKGDLSALRVSSILDKFAGDCANYAINNQNHSSHSMEGLYTNVPQAPVYPDEIDWQAIGVTLAQPILDFGQRVGDARDHLNGLWEVDDWSTISATTDTAIELGRNAIELSERIREQRGLPQRQPWREEWNTKSYLDEQWQAIIVKEEEAAQQAAKPKERLCKRTNTKKRPTPKAT